MQVYFATGITWVQPASTRTDSSTATFLIDPSLIGLCPDSTPGKRRILIDKALDRWVAGGEEFPPEVHKAMRYSLFAGGKRLRPILALAAADLAVGGKAAGALPVACALELIHTYSLIHDDLPAMDDDDLRRGRPTSHKVFGEAMAILAGDALLTLAFRLIAETVPREGTAARRREVLIDVADAAGTRGMVAGQVADLEAEGQPVTAEALDFIHLHKTAALIRTSLRIGAVISGATADAVRALGMAGGNLGLAFQIVVDLLDVEGTSAELGKTAGKDQAQQKATYPAVHGIGASRARARALVAEAEATLERLGPRAEPIRALGRFILERRA